MPLVPESLDGETRQAYWLVNNVSVLLASAGFIGLALARSGSAALGLLPSGVSLSGGLSELYRSGAWIDCILFWGFGACFLGVALMTANIDQGVAPLSEVGIPDRQERWLLGILSVTSPSAAVISLVLFAAEVAGMA